MKEFTEQDIRNLIIDGMRAGRIRTRKLYSILHEAHFYLSIEYGESKASELMNEWVNNYIHPEFGGVNFTLDTTWVLRGDEPWKSKELQKSEKRDLNF